MMRRIYIKPELCAGCKNCVLACMAEQTEHKSVLTLELSNPALQSRNMVVLGAAGKPVPLTCRHCDDPACVNACMAGALTKDADTGIVSHCREKCAGCWMCVMACPFGMIKPDRASGTVALKCDLCAARGFPRCVEACPTGAVSLVEVDSEGRITPVFLDEVREAM